jgi:hypothetical protein
MVVFCILDSAIRMEQLIPLIIISVIVLVYYSRPSQQINTIAYNIPDPGIFLDLLSFLNCLLSLECTGVFNLCTDIDKERLGRQSIRAIHEQMDDDKDGIIKASESSDVSLSIILHSILNVYFFWN